MVKSTAGWTGASSGLAAHPMSWQYGNAGNCLTLVYDAIRVLQEVAEGEVKTQKLFPTDWQNLGTCACSLLLITETWAFAVMPTCVDMSQIDTYQSGLGATCTCSFCDWVMPMMNRCMWLKDLIRLSGLVCNIQIFCNPLGQTLFGHLLRALVQEIRVSCQARRRRLYMYMM